MGMLGNTYRLIGCALAWARVAGAAETVVLDQTQVAREFDSRVWGQEHGLPDNRVLSLCQTRDGYLWVGTQRGLARFDGLSFAVYGSANTPQFSNDECVSLAEDHSGVLWISTRQGLLAKRGDSFVRFDDGDGISLREPMVLRSVRVGGVVAARAGVLAWLWDGRIIRHFIETNALGAASILDIDEGRGGALWLSTASGLLRFAPATAKFEPAFPGEPITNLAAVASRETSSGERWTLFIGPAASIGSNSNNAWLACRRNGAWLKKPDLSTAELAVNAPSAFMVEDPLGSLWFTGDTDGLHRLVNGQVQFIRVLRRSEADWTLTAFSDREGNLWIGTANSGLQRWTARKAVTYTTQDGLADNNVWTVLQAQDDSMWVGTDVGVSQLKNGVFTNFLTDIPGSPGRIRALAQDRGGAVWVGAMSGLHRFSEGRDSPMNLPGEWYETKVRALLGGRDGGVWIGTVRGLTYLRDGQLTKYTKADGLGSDEVRALLEDRAGDLWVGTLGGGVARLHGGKFTVFNGSNGLSHDNAWALLEDREGAIWVGTENGLNRIKDGTIQRFNVAQGLPDKLVNCILEDDHGRLWISHNRGIYWVSRQDLHDVTAGKRSTVRAVLYDVTDGLPGLETNGQKSNPAGCKSRDGRLWFPMTKGLVVIDPAKVVRDEVPPQVVIEEVKANGSTLVRDYSSASQRGSGPGSPDAVHVRPGAGRVLEFRYTANTFVAPERARFRYRLRGLFDQWIDVGSQRQVHFTDLRPREYVFEVSACNHHGVWQENAATLAFRLAPFFYQTWWFYLGSGSAILCLGVVAARWRMGELRKIHDLERLNALNEERKRIARDVHDELGASLTHILQLSADPPLGQTLSPETRSRQIASIAEEAVDNMGEIVWANNPEFDTLDDLVAYLREYAANYLASTALEVSFDFPEHIPSRAVTGLVRRHLLSIVKEALRNAVKHAAARRLRMSLSVSGQQLELRIADDGCGFRPEAARRFGNGVSNMRERVTELGGFFEMESQPNQGTEIRVRISLEPKAGNLDPL